MFWHAIWYATWHLIWYIHAFYHILPGTFSGIWFGILSDIGWGRVWQPQCGDGELSRRLARKLAWHGMARRWREGDKIRDVLWKSGSLTWQGGKKSMQLENWKKYGQRASWCWMVQPTAARHSGTLQDPSRTRPGSAGPQCWRGAGCAPRQIPPMEGRRNP